MKTAYFDCVGGAAGDMIVAALLDAGASLQRIREGLWKLSVAGFDVRTEPVQRAGIACTRFVVHTDPGVPQPHRHLKHIVAILDESGLTDAVRRRAKAIFTRLGQAEARVHGCDIEKVHFHEVGAVDAIVDVVAAALALEDLGIDDVVCSPVPTGSGTVACEHGVMPVPAPATAELLRGVPLAACDEVGEMTTPTGAAVLTTIASSFGPMPAMRLHAIGYGAGTRTWKTRPNALRVLVGTRDDDGEVDEVVCFQANLDDATAETIAFACERLMDAGALDVYTVPIVMKKGRPGVMLAVLARPASAEQLERILFEETTTFGVRRQSMHRTRMVRRHEEVQTPYGRIRIKIGRIGDTETGSPEFDDCRAAAIGYGVPLRVVMDAARHAWQQLG